MLMETTEPLGSLEPTPPKAGFLYQLLRIVGTLFLLGFLALLGLMFINPRGRRSRPLGQVTACKSNCKNIATALEMYASDNKGRYPGHLDQLREGNYLKTLPTCPSAGEMTYTNYQATTRPDQFSFACCGRHHSVALGSEAVNLPAYSSEQGLIDH